MLLFAVALLVAIEWGWAENRLFTDKPLNFDALILAHFKTYHLFIAILFETINTLASAAIFGAFTFAGFLLWVWLMLWETLMLDTWWMIRYLDFKLRPSFALVLHLPEKNAWHERVDWDNWLGLPLLCGSYWWSHMFAAVFVPLDTLILWASL